MEKRTIKIAILDMNSKESNKGLRCIEKIVLNYLKEQNGLYQIFEIRKDLDFPKVTSFDIFISSGGPGTPIPCGEKWERPYFNLLDQIELHNKTHEIKKHLFLICHSFQLACHHWDLAKITKRKLYSFGIMPIYKTEAGRLEIFFENLPNPFYAVDSRAYQIVQPNEEEITKIGAKILCLEGLKPNMNGENPIMAMRISEAIFGTQFHPEADAEGMSTYFASVDQKQKILKIHDEEKYLEILEHLKDENKIALTQKEILPYFLALAAEQILLEFMPV